MNSDIHDTAEAIKGIVEAVPIYEDLLQPAMKELGKGLLTLAKTVNVALTPISALVWGFDQIKAYIIPALEERLKNIPKERIIPPDPTVAGPALEALRYAGHKEDLRELYANLIATAMDSKTAAEAHPSFVDVLKQITPDEAKIIPYFDLLIPIPIITLRGVNKEDDHFNEYLINFSIVGEKAKCQFPELTNGYLENLARLGLIEISYSTYSVDRNAYEPLLNHPYVKQISTIIETKYMKKVDVKKGVASLTNYGNLFISTCIGTKKKYYDN